MPPPTRLMALGWLASSTVALGLCLAALTGNLKWADATAVVSIPVMDIFSNSLADSNCAITLEKKMQCWGNNEYSKLGCTFSGRAQPTLALGNKN